MVFLRGGLFFICFYSYVLVFKGEDEEVRKGERKFFAGYFWEREIRGESDGQLLLFSLEFGGCIL